MGLVDLCYSGKDQKRQRLETPLLYQTDGKAYRYMIREMDKTKNIRYSRFQRQQCRTSSQCEAEEWHTEGCGHSRICGISACSYRKHTRDVIIGVAVLFLVILYIVAELLKKEPQDDYDETDTEPGYVKSKKELKREEKAREKRYKEDERQLLYEERGKSTCQERKGSGTKEN